MYRESYVTAVFGITWGLPGPVTDTVKSTPASAELLTPPVVAPFWFELTVTSVSRPTTAEGLTTKTLPLPLLVLIPATALPMHSPLAVVHELVPSELRVQLC